MIPTMEQLKQVEAILEKDEKVQEVRAKILRAVQSCPKKVSLEKALAQIKLFEAVYRKTKQ